MSDKTPRNQDTSNFLAQIKWLIAELDRKTSLPKWPITWQLSLFLAIVAFVLLLRVPMTGDWEVTFYPAAQNPGDPYANSYHFVYPPWLSLILAPFGLFDVFVGRALFGALSVFVIAYTMRQQGADFFKLLLVALSPFILTVLIRGETDALPLLGLALGLQAGVGYQMGAIILLITKPQTIGPVALVVLCNSERRAQLLISGVLIFGLTLLIFGNWPLEIWQRLPELYRAADVSVWPFGVPVGLYLLYIAVRDENMKLGAVATFFLAPYLSWYSLAAYAVVLTIALPHVVGLLILIISWLLLFLVF